MLMNYIRTVVTGTIFLALASGCFTSQAGESEGALPELPNAITSFGAIRAGNHIYVYGGHAGKAHAYSTDTTLNSFHRLSINSPEKWETLDAGTRIQGTSLVAHGGYIYRVGGLTVLNELTANIDENEGDDNSRANLRSLDDFARFHIRSKKWEQLPPLPAPRSSHDSIVLGHHLFVLGGWIISGDTKEAKWYEQMWVMDLSDSQPVWNVLPQPFRRRAIAVGSHNNDIFAIGGMDSEGDTSNAVDVYDPVDRTWSKGPNLPNGPMKGFGAAACSTPTKLYVTHYAGALLTLNAQGSEWLEVGALKPRRFFHRLVSGAARSLVAIGGANRSEGHLASVQQIHLNKH